MAYALLNKEKPLISMRVHNEIEQLATFSSSPPPAVTRLLLSEEDILSRQWLLNLAQDAGFTKRADAVGNIFITFQGSNPDLPAVATGSHIDAIPNAGKYDGVVGVLGGLEAMRQLKESGFVPTRSIELIMFTAEEPTRFGIGCLGSRLLANALSEEEAFALRSPEGLSIEDLRKGHYEGSLATTHLPTGHYHAFVELHIEQGPLLEEQKVDIGIVEKIAAPTAYRFHFKGAGGHAGAVLMPDRKDAFLAAAEVALLIEKLTKESPSADSVATTGVIQVSPGAINSIPNHVMMELDLRDTCPKTRDYLISEIKKQAQETCKTRMVEFEMELINSDPPALCSSDLIQHVKSSCKELGLSSIQMISRAYHDCLFMSMICPTTMIFIPCYRGYSHRPDEYSSSEAIDKGIEALKHTLKKLTE